jgi:hypothetical protein
MLYISHRGYINGPNNDLENNPEQINNLINKKISIEIDVFFFKNSFYLGHDEPTYQVKPEFLVNDYLWCHAKNQDALFQLKKIKSHFFWHQNDDYTITSNGFIWVYPGKTPLKNSICLFPEKYHLDYSLCYGLCTDYLIRYVSLVE